MAKSWYPWGEKSNTVVGEEMDKTYFSSWEVYGYTFDPVDSVSVFWLPEVYGITMESEADFSLTSQPALINVLLSTCQKESKVIKCMQ